MWSFLKISPRTITVSPVHNKLFKFTLYPKNLECLEVNLNIQLNRVNEWLYANKLTLNIEKSNFVLFHPLQKKENFSVNLKICGKEIAQKKSIKYLGVLMDGHFKLERPCL